MSEEGVVGLVISGTWIGGIVIVVEVEAGGVEVASGFVNIGVVEVESPNTEPPLVLLEVFGLAKD